MKKSSFKPRSSSHHKFWTEFFILYKSRPELWNINSQEYKNDIVKYKACDTMAAKLSELKPGSTHRDVLKQINIFRTNYRRERKRLKECNGHPNLWYYHLLTFLDTQERNILTKRSKINVNNKHDTIEESNSETELYHTDNWNMGTYRDSKLYAVFENHDNQLLNTVEIEIIDENQINEYRSKNKILMEEQKLKNKKQNPISLDMNVETFQKRYNQIKNYHRQEKTFEVEDTTSKASTTFKGAQTMTDETCEYLLSKSSEILAQSWALQYDEMPRQQQIYARRAIADILYAGCISSLGPP